MSLSDETLCCARWRMFAKFIVFLFLNNQALVAAELGNVAFNKPATQMSTYEENGQKWSASNSVDGNINCSNSPTSQYYSATTSGSGKGTWWRVDLQYVYDIKRVIVRGKPTDGNNQLTGFSLYLTDVPVDNPDVSTSVYTNSDYGNGIFNITLSKRARYCMVHRTDVYEPIVLCEVEVYGTVFDLIQMIKPKVSTSMSSIGIYNSEHTSWKSSNAIDKVIYGDPNTCGCCIGTSGNEAPWWQIDLGKVYGIGVIKIYGRTDISSPAQYQNLSIFVGNNSMENVNGTLVYSGNPNNGSYTFTLPLTPPVSFRYLMIRRFTISTLTLCEVELIEQRNLVDRLKNSVITTQSSLFQDSTDYMSSNAIDRQRNYSIDTCQCCSVTKELPSPSWWQIDLRNRYLVDTVEVFSRQTGNPEQLQNANIYASNVSFDQGLNSSVKVVQVPTFSNALHFIQHLQYPVTAQFVFVVLDDNILILCEFNVYGTGPICDTGSFGNYCSQRCHCSDNQLCHYITGICHTPGCLPGWMGSACDTECPPGRFGNSCTQTCRNCSQTSCNNTDGLCLSGCVPGYQPNDDFCRTQCSSGRFGNNCTQSCHNCSQMSCNYTDGLCFTECVPGYKPNDVYCRTPCDDGRYGQNCSKSCNGHCYRGNSQCNKTDGKCKQGCADGYTGETCETPCPSGRFGNNCTQTCRNCSKMSCNNTDGLCLTGCVPGYKPNELYCRTPCASGNYGHNCTSSCSGNCLNGIAQCDTTNGTCKQGCDRGYLGERCDSKCQKGKYGFNCNETCRHCKHEGICDFQSDNCPDGCSPGFNGSRCDRVCDVGHFGPGCIHSCHCINNTACNNVNGVCYTVECEPGWIGVACDTDNNVLHRLKTIVKTYMSTVANNWTSDRAVDGNIGPDPEMCECCSGTGSSPLSWWMVDFGENIPIRQIIIYSRNNENNFRRLEGFQLGLSNNITYNSFSFKSVSKKMFSKVYEIQLPNILTRYIKIQKPGILTLCEVEALQGVCELGRFGHECAQSCQCADNKPCNIVTGYCQSTACKTGWLGPACNEKCPPETFGEDCSGKCYCAEGTCTNNYGICPGKCRSGYHGPQCNEIGSDMQTNPAILGGAVGATGTLIVVTVIIGIVVYRVRRQKRSNSKNEYATPHINVTSTENQEYDTLENVNDNRRLDNNTENERVTGL